MDCSYLIPQMLSNGFILILQDNEEKKKRYNYFTKTKLAIGRIQVETHIELF